VGAKARLAKLTRPATAAAYARLRLFEAFEKPDAAPVVWLTGPPGCGKTTLVGDYTTRRGIDSLWYQVDRPTDAA
jgi:ATP/maltotriose-dependent transcriptional regulator MalT